MQAVQPRKSSIRTPKSCSRKEGRGTPSPGSPGSSAAWREQHCSAPPQHPALPALPGSWENLPASSFPNPGSAFRGWDDVTRKAGGRAPGWAGSGTFHVSRRAQSHLCAHTAPRRGRVSLAQMQHCSPRVVTPLAGLHPRGPLQPGLEGGWTPCTASGCPTTRLTPAPAAPCGTDTGSAHTWAG